MNDLTDWKGKIGSYIRAQKKYVIKNKEMNDL